MRYYVYIYAITAKGLPVQYFFDEKMQKYQKQFKINELRRSFSGFYADYHMLTEHQFLP